LPNLGIGLLEGLMAALELQPGEEPGRRGQIIRAAATVLGRVGYSDSSVKQIAHEAGVAPGLVHYYFTSKEELLVAVVHDLEREMVADWQSAVAGIEDPLGRIVAAVDHTAVRCSEHPEFFRLLFDLYVLGLNNPAIRERCVELWTHFVDDIEAEVRQVLGRLPGEATVPPRDLAEAIAGAIDGVALAGLLRESDPIDAYEALKSMLLSLVVTAYVQAGEEPPVARMRALLDRRRGSGAAR
jgi:TetR/AcrR family transcriptional repressor of bet genes